MPTTPQAAFAAVVQHLATHADQAAFMVKNGGKTVQVVGRAVLAALAAGKADTQVGCKAFLAALAPAVDEATTLVKHGRGRQRTVSQALLAARHDAGLIKWTPPPPTGPGKVVISGSPGDVATVTGQPTVVRTALKRDGDLAAAASCTWRYTGLGPTELSDTATFAPGSAASEAAVTVPAALQGADPLPFQVEILPEPLVGLTLGEPHVATGRLLPPAPPPLKATVDFDEIIGEIARSSSAQTVRQVKVLRHGSTHAPGTAAVQVTGLPSGVLVAAEPATFKAGQARSTVALRFYPAPRAAAAATAPLTGTADLAATPDLDPGTAASQQFTVVDAVTPPPPTVDNPFHLPGVDLGPLPFLLGFSMGVKAADRDIWIKEIGRPPLCASGGSHNGGRTTTWQGVRGGDKGVIGRLTQLDIGRGQTNLGDATGVALPGTADLLVAGWRSVPDDVQESDYVDLANGSHDTDAYIMGWNAWLLLKGLGYTGAQLVVRADKEYNGGGYGVTVASAPLRAKWLARFTLNFNQGYLDAGADARPRHILGLAQHEMLGPLEVHIPIGPNGQVMVDAIDISAHPANQLNAYEAKPWDEQVAAVAAWLRGDVDRRIRYSHDHVDPDKSGLVAAKNHGILISNFESAPRDDVYACHIAAAGWQGMFDFWTRNAAMLAGVGVYNHTALNRAVAIPGWSAGVDALVRLAKGGAP